MREGFPKVVYSSYEMHLPIYNNVFINAFVGAQYISQSGYYGTDLPHIINYLNHLVQII